ncbi:hypothetical protein EVAR_15752_1 [Eumeta japonica]|uniref:Uncharacterized protein n=1 Tax=Eumeta variegata TaxID=151549 RepID=A0A4C1ZBP2_EUMVA|nr:hypothetical protein EVAR_15752_1 [Eumeta japonica]
MRPRGTMRPRVKEATLTRRKRSWDGLRNDHRENYKAQWCANIAYVQASSHLLRCGCAGTAAAAGREDGAIPTAPPHDAMRARIIVLVQPGLPFDKFSFGSAMDYHVKPLNLKDCIDGKSRYVSKPPSELGQHGGVSQYVCIESETASLYLDSTTRERVAGGYRADPAAESNG